MAHADNPAKQKEHMAVLDLVKHNDATHVAVKSGNWSDASTWKGGKVVVATNDGAVTTYQTETTEGPSTLENLGDSDKNIFQRNRIPGVLDVEEGSN